jgi:hypothetical protein
MVNSRDLGFHLHRIAWLAATRELEQQRIRPADPWAEDDSWATDDHWGPRATESERRASCLALLYIYAWMIKILQRRIDWTINEALAAGATYGDIAGTCGISRQAARQRWQRLRQRRDVSTARPARGLASIGPDGTWANGLLNKLIKVSLVGGPMNGERTTVRHGEMSKFAVAPSPDSPDPAPLLARYVPKDDDLTVYVFDGLETDPDAVPADGSVSRTHKPRVYEIAKEFGVESTDVMNQLKRMGGFVRSASSTVEPDALRRLWEHFEAKRTESPRREMPPSSRS